MNSAVPMPRAMAYAWWNWPSYVVGDQLSVTVTLGNNPEPMRGGGLFLIGCAGLAIGNQGIYFGIQTDLQHDTGRWTGKGAIFSRWYDDPPSHTVRMSDTRIPDDGWAAAGDNEGSFASVRKNYDWEPGTYTMTLSAAETDQGGKWFEYWVVNEETEAKTWIGSLRFPVDITGQARIWPRCGTTIEAYGRRTRTAAEISYWKVTQETPLMDGEPAYLNTACYPRDIETLRNARVVFDAKTQTAAFEVGLDYIAHDHDPERMC